MKIRKVHSKIKDEKKKKSLYLLTSKLIICLLLKRWWESIWTFGNIQFIILRNRDVAGVEIKLVSDGVENSIGG